MQFFKSSLLKVYRCKSDDLGIFFINWHRPFVLQISPINIQARLQATRDAASCSKQIGIPLAQR